MEQGVPLPADEIQEELGRILASEGVVNAARARRFLSYVVEKTLSGREDEIKELILGIEVFDRPSDFDPRVDTIVRVEAGKLRKRLETYYEKDNTSGGVRIEIPKGNYVPQFIRRVHRDTPVSAPLKPQPYFPRWIYVAG